MLDVREYLDEDGTSPFADWFTGLDATAAAKITVVLACWAAYKRRKRLAR